MSEEKAVQYIHHTRAGTETERAGRIAWKFSWTAPSEPRQPVLAHLATNAANRDDSEFGDFIYHRNKYLILAR